MFTSDYAPVLVNYWLSLIRPRFDDKYVLRIDRWAHRIWRDFRREHRWIAVISQSRSRLIPGRCPVFPQTGFFLRAESIFFGRGYGRGVCSRHTEKPKILITVWLCP